MPESTPIYGFTTPCPGETITSSAFSTLANQIDAKLLELRADEILALNRPNVDATETAYQTISAGVDTVLTSLVFTYTAPMAGVYIVRAEINDNPGLSPTISSLRVKIRQNGVDRFAFKVSTPNNSVAPVVPIGPIVAAAGDVFTTMALFVGAGTLQVRGSLQVKMLVRIA